jgi:hypothetical protein
LEALRTNEKEEMRLKIEVKIMPRLVKEARVRKIVSLKWNGKSF